MIKLINAIGETVNADPEGDRFLKVAFVPNFNVQDAHAAALTRFWATLD